MTHHPSQQQVFCLAGRLLPALATTFTNVHVQAISNAACTSYSSEEKHLRQLPRSCRRHPLWLVSICRKAMFHGWRLDWLQHGVQISFIGGTIGNGDNTAGTTGLYLDCGAATGHHQFIGTFLTKNGGDSFILIRLGATDGLDTLFPISFYNVIGEYNTNQPTTGLHLFCKLQDPRRVHREEHPVPDTSHEQHSGDGGGDRPPDRCRHIHALRWRFKPSHLPACGRQALNLLSESAITFSILRSSNLLHNTGRANHNDLRREHCPRYVWHWFLLSDRPGLAQAGQ